MEETQTTTEGQPFMVTDRKSAEWALRKIASKQRLTWCVPKLPRCSQASSATWTASRGALSHS